MNKDTIVSDADKLLDQMTKGLSPDSLEWMKENFERHIPKFLSEPGHKIEMSLVVDANNIIRALLQYAKGKASLLFKLADNPIFMLYAPKEAEKEVLAALHKKKNIDIVKALEGWSKLKTILKFDRVRSEEALLGAKELIGRRDPKDVAFVALYLQIGAAGILTDDKDYDHPLISKTNIEQVGEMVARFHRGMLSFVVLHDLAPITIKALFDLLVVTVRSIFDLLKFLYETISGIAAHAMSRIIKAIANLPSWVKAVVLGILVGAGVALILDEKLRSNIIEAIRSAWNKIRPKIEALIKWIEENSDSIMQKMIVLAPYVEATTMVLLKLADNIAQVIKETKLAAARVSASAS